MSSRTDAEVRDMVEQAKEQSTMTRSVVVPDRPLYEWPDGLWRYTVPPTLPTVFTAGYAGRTFDTGKPYTAAHLFHTAKLLDAVVLDVRTAPFSKDRPEWCQAGPLGLAARFRTRYRHVPALGNRNYRPADRAKGVEIADLESGLAEVLAIVSGGHSPILLCGCAELAGCHRSVIAAALGVAGQETKELTWFTRG